VSSTLSKLIFETQKLLATRLSRIEPFLKATACMNRQYRELYAYCEIYKTLFPEDREFNDFLDKIVKPALQKLGHAAWLRDIITDMGLKIGTQTTTMVDLGEEE